LNIETDINSQSQIDYTNHAKKRKDFIKHK